MDDAYNYYTNYSTYTNNNHAGIIKINYYRVSGCNGANGRGISL